MKKSMKYYLRQSMTIFEVIAVELFVRSLTVGTILLASSIYHILFLLGGVEIKWTTCFMAVVTLLICRNLYRMRIRAEKFGDRIDAIRKSETWINRHAHRLERSRFNATVQSRNQAVVDRLDRS